MFAKGIPSRSQKASYSEYEERMNEKVRPRKVAGTKQGEGEREASLWPGCERVRWVWEHAQGRVMDLEVGLFPPFPTTRLYPSRRAAP